jgi:hypothetical protein
MFAALVPRASLRAQADTATRLDAGRFTVVAYPRDLPLARNLLAQAQRNDTFPGLARPRAHVTIAIAPDARRFRELAGGLTPEWGAAFAFPESSRILMQGSSSGSSAGDPFPVLRHELAHLALHEAMGDLPPRWFDEGYASYAARETARDEYFATNLALVWGGMPGLAELDDWFYGGGGQAEAAYALSHRAVVELAEIDRVRGLALFFEYWRENRRLDQAVRRAYGLTLASFENRWQSRVRRQYGWLALFTDFTLVTAITLAPLLPFYIARRRRDRRRLAAMRVADAAEEARRREESGLRAILGLPVEAEEVEEGPEERAGGAKALVEDDTAGDASDDSSPTGGRRAAD